MVIPCGEESASSGMFCCKFIKFSVSLLASGFGAFQPDDLRGLLAVPIFLRLQRPLASASFRFGSGPSVLLEEEMRKSFIHGMAFGQRKNKAPVCCLLTWLILRVKYRKYRCFAGAGKSFLKSGSRSPSPSSPPPVARAIVLPGDKPKTR